LGCTSTDQALNLLLGDHRFEFYKLHGYWRLTWLLILEFIRLIKILISLSEHLY
jgi:hypothetical protein